MTAQWLEGLQALAAGQRADEPSVVRLATVAADHVAGDPRLVFDGESTATAKAYPRLQDVSAGQRVMCVRAGSTYVVAGPVEDPRSSLAMRMGATPGSGGGRLSWNGSVLSGSARYIWIPGGARNGWHANLEAAGGGPWSVTVPPWSSVSVRLTSEQWASAARYSVQPEQLVVTDYGATEQPRPTDLLLGVHNGDDGLFYLQDGRVLDYWRDLTPYLVNGWTQWNATDWKPQFMKTGNGLVIFKGLIKDGTSRGTYNPAFQPPVGYRAGDAHIVALPVAQGGTRNAEMRPSGLLPFGVDGTSWVSLQPISYFAEN